MNGAAGRYTLSELASLGTPCFRPAPALPMASRSSTIPLRLWRVARNLNYFNPEKETRSSMRSPVYRGAWAIAVCAIVAIMGAGSPASAQNPSYPQSPSYPQGAPPQDKKDKGAQPSDAERQAATKVTSAADFNAALQAAGEFVKKHPKSSLRPEV